MAAANHSACQTKHRFFAWVFKRNIRLSFALRSEAAQLFKAIALKMDLRFGTFHSGRALALRTLATTRNPYGVSTGPVTLDRCCEGNVVAPGEYSKRFFCILFGLYEGAFRPATARRMPAKSALAGLSSINPAAVIKPSTSSL